MIWVLVTQEAYRNQFRDVKLFSSLQDAVDFMEQYSGNQCDINQWLQDLQDEPNEPLESYASYTDEYLSIHRREIHGVESKVAELAIAALQGDPIAVDAIKDVIKI